MSSRRQEEIAAVRAGDVIRGRKSSGSPLLLLVYEADSAMIRTRRVTTGEKIDFDRNGRSLSHALACTISSTRRLPPADYKVVIGLDQKMRSARSLTDLALSADEIALLLKVDEFFAAHALPEQ